MVLKIKRVKTPTVIQMEAVECGAASLGIVLGYFGKNVPLEELRYECGVSRDGCNALNVIKAAKKYNMEAKGLILKDGMPLETVLKNSMPLILFWKMSHFLVLEGFSRNKFYLNDPAFGPRRISLEEFKEDFSKIYIKLTPDENFTRANKTDNVFKSLFKRINDNKKNLFFAFLISLSLIIPGIIIPGMNKVFIDDYLMKGETSYFNAIITIIALFSISSLVLTWLLQTLLVNLETKLLVNSSYDFMNHILKLPIKFFSQRSVGDIVSRLQSNASIASTLSHGITTNMFYLLQVLFYMLIMFLYSIELTVVMIFFAIINIFIFKITKRVKRDAAYRVAEAEAKMMGTTMIGSEIIESLKASGIEGDFFNKWSGYLAKYINTFQQQSVLNMISNSIPFLCSQLSIAIMFGLGAYFIVNGNLSIGGLIAFSLLAKQFNSPINGIVDFGNNLQEVAIDFKRLDDVLNYPVDKKFEKKSRVDDSHQTKVNNNNKQNISQKNIYKLSGKIELKNITFGYSRLDPPLIQNFNLILHPGDRVALVGTSGSGKSTIAKLISGLYQPWEGEILFDDIPMHKIRSEILANSFSMVDQTPFFFKGTIKDNLTMWDQTIPDLMLKKVTSNAEVYDEITSRHGAFESEINEGGSNFSGGQLQRMEIARSLINDPSLLILDEATSALDPIVEKNIYNNLWNTGCSFIIIAHRLSAVRDSNEIIVLEDGNIVERGKHELLLKNKGSYFDLVSNE